MPEEVAFFVAKNVRSNVRELEGALRKILAYSRFNQKESRSSWRARRCATCCPSRTARSRGKHPEDGGRLLQDQGRRHVQQEAPGQHCPAAPDCHVPGQGADAKSLPEIGELFGGATTPPCCTPCARLPASASNTELNQQLHVLEQTLKVDENPSGCRGQNGSSCGHEPPHRTASKSEVDMIVLKATQDKVLAVLQSVSGIVERRHTLPILANVLIRKTGNALQLTTSDLEIQIRTTAELGGDTGDFTTTVGARKLIDILRPCPATRP
jgi:hypothetical protein